VGAIPTFAEVEAALTAPGGMFEVTADVVNGVDVKVYRDRLRTLGELLAMGLPRGDDTTYLVHGDRRIGFGTFGELAASVSAALRHDLGMERGDRVAVLAGNIPEWVITFWATVTTGGVIAGLNGWWKADEILYGLNHSGARFLVADAARFERIAARLDDAPALEAVFVVGDTAGESKGRRVCPFDDLLGRQGEPPPDVAIEEDDPAVILYTSGTTGLPKGAVSTHRSVIASVQNQMFNAVAGAMVDGGGVLEQDATTTYLLASPFFHVSGCHSGLVVGMLGGITMVLPVGRFDPEQVLRLMQHERVQVWGTIPAMAWKVVEHPARHDYDLSSVTSVAYGGSPSAVELQRRLHETFPNLRTLGTGYGLTETSSAVTIISGEEYRRRPSSAGRPLPVVDLRIVAPVGRDASTGEPGEVWVRGPGNTPGYWNDPDATDSAFVDGWFRTGDVGRLDDEGYLYIEDRLKDVIIRGGENVYPAEIENRLMEHDAVLDVAVVGVPHPILGEEVRAIVQARPGATLSPDDVRRWVDDALAHFKVPAQVEIRWDSLPRNATGKVLKTRLVADARAESAVP
jgi:long-chain acyl-CoA synthetase